MNGYSEEYIVNKDLAERFMCPICLSICKNVTECSKCGNLFCNVCILDSIKIKKECPLCRKLSYFHKSKWISRQIQELQIMCPFIHFIKCLWKGKLGQLHFHIETHYNEYITILLENENNENNKNIELCNTFKEFSMDIAIDKYINGLKDKSIEDLIYEQYRIRIMNKKYYENKYEKPICMYFVDIVDSKLLVKFMERFLQYGFKSLYMIMTYNKIVEELKFLCNGLKMCSNKSYVKFKNNYLHYLSLRLLGDKKLNIDNEIYMKNILKSIHYPSGFIITMEQMISDYRSSCDTLTEYKKYRSTKILAVTLCSHAWPISKYTIIVPKQLKQITDNFSAYCNKKYKKKLKWSTNGNAELKIKINSGFKSIICSTLQMMIMLLFNTNKEITYKKIVEKMNVSLLCLSFEIYPLIKQKILIKKPEFGLIHRNDILVFNQTLDNSVDTIKIENIENPQTLTMQTNFIIDAKIVKIMKHRNNYMSHNDLVSQVINRLTKIDITSTIREIETRIKCLIEREYIESTYNSWYSYMP